MKFLRANADLRAKAKLEPIRKPRRGIDINRRSISPLLKGMCRTDVIRHNRLGMPRPIAIDVPQCGIHIRDDTDGEDEVTVLRRPVLLRCRSHVAEDRTCLCAATQLHSIGTQLLCHLRQKCSGNITVYEHGLRRVADRGARNLGIPHDTTRHREVRCAVNIDMTDAGSRLDHGDAAALHDMANQSGPAAWNEDIQQPREMRHHIHGSALLHREHLNGSRRNAGSIGSA